MCIILDANCFGNFRDKSNRICSPFASGWLKKKARLPIRILRNFEVSGKTVD